MKKYYLLAYEKIYKSRFRVSDAMDTRPLEYTLKALNIKHWASKLHDFDENISKEEVKAKLLEMYGSEIPPSCQMIEVIEV